MKKNIIITFDIYQNPLDKQNPDFTIYSESSPDNENKMSIDELNKSGLKKVIKIKPERKAYSEKLAEKYIIRIPEDKIKELLDF